MISSFRLCLLVCVFVTIVRAGNGKGGRANIDTPVETQTIADVIRSLDNLSILTSLLELTDLIDSVASDDVQLTLFAPSNEAFQEIPPRFGQDEDFRPHLTAILLYHVVPENLGSCELQLVDRIDTLNGEALSITSLDPITVNESIVIDTEKPASNGVVYVIDKVLLPSAATDSIVDIASKMSSLTTFTNAIVAAEIGDILADFDSAFTVFAPSNDAFESLPKCLVEALLLPRNVGDLIDVLLFHVIQDEVLTSDKLCEGCVFGRQDLKITDLDPPMINAKSKVTTANTLANNGIVHIIDAVLLPPTLDLRKLGIGPSGSPLLHECEFDCDVDDDCAPGLLCADQHKPELEQYGFDPRKAYCDPAVPASGFEGLDSGIGEVCYDPELIRSMNL